MHSNSASGPTFPSHSTLYSLRSGSSSFSCLACFMLLLLLAAALAKCCFGLSSLLVQFSRISSWKIVRLFFSLFSYLHFSSTRFTLLLPILSACRRLHSFHAILRLDIWSRTWHLYALLFSLKILHHQIGHNKSTNMFSRQQCLIFRLIRSTGPDRNRAIWLCYIHTLVCPVRGWCLFLWCGSRKK